MAANGGVVWRGDRLVHQREDRRHQPFGLAQRQLERSPQHEACLNSGIGIPRLAIRPAGLPVFQRAILDPRSHILIDSTGLQVFGAGQWLEEKHGAKSRRTWRKLHLAVDAGTGMIVAHTLTDHDTDDPSQVAPLLDQIDGRITRVTADGAYDGDPTYQTIAGHGDDIKVVIPPRSTAVPSGEASSPTQRDRHLDMISEQGRLAWQVSNDYGQRSLVETTMGRYKVLIGPRLRARGFAVQQTEAAIGVAVLNRMLAAGRPDSVRRQLVIA
jgi:transposase